ncbi:MAG TPA: protease pro-enzyme activation domain-containing protein [Amycolatopsis sp.]|jgi:subtilase family serine protease
MGDRCICAAALTIAGTATAGAAPGRGALIGISRTQGFIDHGAVPAATPVSENVYLAVKGPDTLAARAKAMSDPHNSGYARFLSLDRIRELNQLDPAQTGRVRDWLTAAGLSVSQPGWRL